MSPIRSLLPMVAAAAVLVAGCGEDQPDPEVANPASVFCVEQGGEVEIVDEEGGQVGYCILPDGTRVEEWEYYRENAPTTDP